ncbi:hypothetical protein HY844_02440 [Candidatus Berkelbacteria bacterium]|nr:hypothetical protein [Candidatus Berkelbacteria bacterium]
MVFITAYIVFGQPTDSKFHLKIRHLGAIGAMLAIITGFLMGSKYNIKYLGNFWMEVKLGLILADGIIAEFIIKRLIEKDEKTKLGQLKFWAVLSVIIIIAIVIVSAYRDKLRG